jgi:hypothetical protein
MTGLSRCFAEHSPHTELVLADPVGSILAEYINQGTLSDKSASWMVEGIGEDFLPTISDFSRVRKAYAISDKESFLTARMLLEKEGTTVALFLSPVFYPATALPEAYRFVFLINPLTFIIEQAREVVIWGRPPNWAGLALYVLASLGVSWMGFWTFQKMRRGFADVL